MTMIEVDDKKLSELEVNALALRKIANIVLAGVEQLRTASAKPRSKKRMSLDEAEAKIMATLLKRNSRRKMKLQNEN